MADNSLICRREGCGTPVQISDAGAVHRLMLKLRQLYVQSTGGR
ncbi:hypothetical protein [Paracidovorax oryzae]|nr:hypothetical protein [Paracidovorax oryzae]